SPDRGTRHRRDRAIFRCFQRDHMHHGRSPDTECAWRIVGAGWGVRSNVMRHRGDRTRRTNWYIAPNSSATIEPKKGQKAASVTTLSNCSKHTAARMANRE